MLSPTRVGHSKPRVWPVILWVAGAFWASMALLEALAFSGYRGLDVYGVYVMPLGARIVSYFVTYLLSAGLYRLALLPGWPSDFYGRAKAVLIHLLLALVFLRLAGASTDVVMGIASGRWSELDPATPRYLEWKALDWAWSFRMWLPRYALGLVLVAFALMVRRYQSELVRVANLSAEHAHTRLAMLSAQLQPHFLFNALNVTSELVVQSPDKATEMLARLGDFLRHALETSRHSWVSVDSELKGLEAYLAVQEVRFGEHLQVISEVDEDARALGVPAMLLQPLVENAIDHGRAGSNERLTVFISLRRSGQTLEIVITNDRPTLDGPLPRSGYGYGLHNVEARLNAAFGDAASLTVRPAPERGTQARIIIPILATRPAYSTV